MESRGSEDPPAATGEGFTRRVCAVLLADVTGFSALMGEDAEGTARAVQDLQALVRGVVAEAKGYAEPRAGDSVLATFDSVVAAVDTALAIQRLVAAREFAGRRLQMRIGVHFGDVLLREGNTPFGDAINVAARLQALARPGTICISDGVRRHVSTLDERFVDLGRQHLKNISEPVHAYLIVPRELEAGHIHAPRRSAMAWGVGSAGLALAVMLAVVMTRPYRNPPEPPPDGRIISRSDARGAVKTEQVALGVMLFKSLGDEAGNDWRREALRDGLNTQLSQLGGVKVYSKEFIDFLISRKGLTEIEAAAQLGIKKMLSGSFQAVSGTLSIETHVVDVASGVLESSYTTVGSDRDFLGLQNKMTFEVISNLSLPVTEEEKHLLLAEHTTSEEALKMLLEAEGSPAPLPPPPGPSTDAPRSALPTWLARYGLLARPAFADNGGTQAEILAVLERYRQATEAGQLQALAALYAEFPPEQQAAQQRYFANVHDLKVAIENVDIAVVGDEAVVSYTRTDDFADARTGRPMHVAVRLTKILRKNDGDWRLAGSQ